MHSKNPIILFDGVCNLCNGTIDFLLKHDRKKQFRYVPLQSNAGKIIIKNFQIPVDTETVILLRLNQVYIESDAIIEISGMLSYPWKLGIVGKIMPKKIRDGIYRIISKNRYRWFGKRDQCRIPCSDEKEFFMF